MTLIDTEEAWKASKDLAPDDNAKVDEKPEEKSDEEKQPTFSEAFNAFKGELLSDVDSRFKSLREDFELTADKNETND